MDFAALPPEINSGRMYAGAGAAPLMAAASAWDGVASELSSAASSYRSVVSGLTSGSWLGPSSMSMAAAAASYTAWMSATAAQAEQTANQARSAAAAYEEAFTATVPPAVVAANRATLAALVATNILGQNTAAIMANEAQYAEMWAQDAGVMYGYSAASTAAAQLIPFNAAPQTTNEPASTSQAAAASLGTAANSGQSLGSANGPFGWLINALNSPWVTGYEALTSTDLISTLTGLDGNINDMATGLWFIVDPATDSAFIPLIMMIQATVTAHLGGGLTGGLTGSATATSGLAGSYGSGAGPMALVGADTSASLGRAASVGGLSVPQSWGSAAPEIRLAANSLPLSALDATPPVAALPGGLQGGTPMVGPIGSVVNAPRSGENHNRPRSCAEGIAQTANKDGGQEGTRARWVGFDEYTETGRPLSEHEKLRKAIATVAKERDLLKRSASLLIKEALQ
ncbi:PPE family protein [Candidatus Mycobacterium methanotrophicum]